MVYLIDYSERNCCELDRNNFNEMAIEGVLFLLNIRMIDYFRIK